MFTSSCRTFTKATDTQTALTRDTSEFKQWTCCEDKGHGDSKNVVPLVCPGKYVFCWQKLIAIATGNLGGVQAEFRFKGARRGTSVKSRQRFSTNTLCSFNFQHSVTVSFIHQETQRWQVVRWKPWYRLRWSRSSEKCDSEIRLCFRREWRCYSGACLRKECSGGKIKQNFKQKIR